MVNFSNLDTLTIRDYHYRAPKSNEIICKNYIDEVRVGLTNVDAAWEYVSEIISDTLQHIPYRFKIERYETSSHYFGGGVQDAAGIYNLALGKHKAKCLIRIYYNDNYLWDEHSIGQVLQLPDYTAPWEYDRNDIKDSVIFLYDTYFEQKINYLLQRIKSQRT